jgi:acetylornithine/N-succinyldiaminopimelate aminotransferase
VLTAGSHGSTFGGNPVCCAGALHVLGRLDENLLAGVRAREAFIRGAL